MHQKDPSGDLWVSCKTILKAFIGPDSPITANEEADMPGNQAKRMQGVRRTACDYCHEKKLACDWDKVSTRYTLPLVIFLR